VDDGFMYVTDTWSRVMKFDVRSGTAAVPLWRYDPKITRSRTTRGLAMYGNKIFLSTYDARLIALNRDSGEVAWEIQASAPMDPKTGTPSKTQAFSGAPLTIKTAGGRELVVQGESTGGSQGTRSWVGAFEADTGKLVWRTFTIPAPGEPGSETWKDSHNAWRIGGASVWQTASYDPATNLLYYGTGDAFPTFDPEYRPGDNLYTASTIALDADTGKMVWYFQETPNEHWDFDTPSPKMLYEVVVNGEPRKVVANFSRNGFFYTLDRNSGQFLRADQYQEKVTWTKGIDPKTGKPVDYDPSLDVQRYAGIGQRRGKPGQEACPWYSGSPTFFPRVDGSQFPISTTMTGVVLEMAPGALRELHWHPNAAEWQYILSGKFNVTMFGSGGRWREETLGQGDVGYIPQGFGHSIENVGAEKARILIVFNSGHYQTIDLSQWIAGNPVDILATNFSVDASVFEKFPRRDVFLTK
jgi:alcohol dehydrogenase (cytochrome c)